MIAQLDREYVAAARARTIVRLASYVLFEGRPATTRGQWVNPLVLAHLRLAARLGPRRVERPIFLVGIGRSGTTLLGRLLAVHPQVGFLNEPKAVWHTACPGEDVSGFYHQGPARVRLGADDATPEACEKAQRLFGYYCWLTRSARVVDKYPESTYRRAFLRAIFPDAVLVAIVRRPAAVVRSIVRWSETHRRGDSDWWGVGSRKWHLFWDQMVQADPRRRELFCELDPRRATPAQRALTEWIVGMDELTAAHQDPRARLDALVRYEELVSRPAEVMGEVIGAGGLDPSARVDDLARRSVVAPPSASGGRAHWGSLQPEVDRLLAMLGYRG